MRNKNLLTLADGTRETGSRSQRQTLEKERKITMTFNQICGLPDMTFEEELALPENMMHTKQNKIKIISRCCSMRRALETIESRAHGAPLLDDPKHAELVQQLADIVKEAEKVLWKAADFGMS